MNGLSQSELIIVIVVSVTVGVGILLAAYNEWRQKKLRNGHKAKFSTGWEEQS